jgi:glyoxylase-like metal-dependent hydrolase (beta-lactamase superfamily II)/ferredoxin
MANPERAVSENVPGNFFVDSSCIDCDACRQLAPSSFKDAGTHSYVYQQPASPEQERSAYHALLACPTGSIGTHRRNNRAKDFIDDFPLNIDENVYYCGFNSEKSYGGNSFFIAHPEGNWLVDSPKFLPQLVEKFRELGGLKYIFLTHQDDVADANKYSAEFSAKRIIHQLEYQAQPDSEIVLTEEQPFTFAPDFEIIPVPGHTEGHIVLLYKEKYLFSGDHLFFDVARDRLSASRDYCWFSWTVQIKSMAALATHRFEWILAGHGNRVRLSPEAARKQTLDLVKRMRLPEAQWQAA